MGKKEGNEAGAETGEGAKVMSVKKPAKPVDKVGTKVKKNDMVTIEGTGQGKFYPAGKTSRVHKLFAKKMVDKGVAKIVGVLLLLCVFTFGGLDARAQVNLVSEHGLVRDTVTNTGTAYLQARIAGHKNTLGFHVVVTAISGTVAGTITLQGSNDGVNFVALTDTTSVPSIPAKTVANASASYAFWLQGSPFLYYRVSWTGSGTMVASFTCRALAH